MSNFEKPMGMDSPDNFNIELPQSDIFREYEKRMLQLGIQMAPLRQYITAKKDFDQLEHEIQSLMLEHNPNEKSDNTKWDLVQEKITLMHRYNEIINEAEKEGAPKDVLAASREKLEELKKMQQRLKEVIEVGKKSPELN